MRVLLYGGFGGWLNFGDLLQLRGILRFYQNRNFNPLILLHKGSLQSPFHLELLKTHLSEDLLFYERGKFLGPDIKEVSGLEVDIFHLYGGGFFNTFWGKAQLEVVERALHFFKPRRYFITGQQVSKDFLLPLKRHIELFKPEVFAVRDAESLKICKEAGFEVEFSFDDSAEYLLEVREKIFVDVPHHFKNFKKGALFLHLNLSYYTLGSEDEIWALRERIKPYLEEADEVILVKSFQNYSLEVKDTLRAVDYIFLTHEKPTGRFLDLASFSLRENWEELKDHFPEIFSEKAFAVSNSYHTALFFTFLGIPSFLIKVNPYYLQKGCEMWDGALPQGDLKDLPEHKERQKRILSQLLEKRAEFLKRFSEVLEEEASFERPYSSDNYTYEDLSDFGITQRVEIDSYVKNLRDALAWHEEERQKLVEYAKKLEYRVSRLEEKTACLEGELRNLREERDNLREELEKIYRSRGWKVLSFYYRIKHWLLVKLGVIKEG